MAKKLKKEKPKQGRPTSYTKKLGEEICAALSMGWSLRQIDEHPDFPSKCTILAWVLDEDKKDFADLYARAQQVKVLALVDEIIDIADNHEGYESQKARIRIDTRKFLAAKIVPKIYGEKLDITSDGKGLSQPIINLTLNPEKFDE